MQMREEKTVKKLGVILAKDCKCTKCGKKAVAFWPACDPDIKSFPWCRKCLDKAKFKLLIKIQNLK